MADHVVCHPGGDEETLRVRSLGLVTKADVVLFEGNLKECRTWIARNGGRRLRRRRRKGKEG